MLLFTVEMKQQANVLVGMSPLCINNYKILMDKISKLVGQKFKKPLHNI